MTVVSRLARAVVCVALLALAGCGQAAVANHPAGQVSSATDAPPTAAPTPAPTPTATPVPPTPTPPPAPALSLAFGMGTVTVSVTAIAAGGHQVHVHRDCTGNPNLHITTLGTVFVNADGASSAGTRTFSLPASLRGHGYDLLVYPLGASQGPPSLCSAI